MKYLTKETAKKAYDLLTSRIGLLAIIVFLLMLFLQQCRKTQSAAADAKREHNNYLASQDSVRLIKKDRDHAIYEKSAFQLKVSELNEKQKDLIKQLALKSNGRGTTPRTIIDVVTEYRDTGRVVSSVIKGKDGVDSISFKYDPRMEGNNSFSISGKTPYTIKLTRDPLDSTKYTASIITDSTNLSISQTIEIVTGIYQDPKTKRLMTRLSTKFPNLTFKEVNAFDITDNPETRKTLKKARKELGLGLTLGYGISGNQRGINTGIIIGVGLHYTPRWLQFGK